MEVGGRWVEAEGLHRLTIREVREVVVVSNVITQETAIERVAEIINLNHPLEGVHIDRSRLKEHAFAGVNICRFILIVVVRVKQHVKFWQK